MPLFCYTYNCMNRKINNDELIDLVDEEGSIIGQSLRSVVYAKGLKNYRVVDVFVKNPKGEFFICKRAPHKTIAPGKYESCGEHIHPGESDIDAARRGVRKEFGIDTPSLQFQFIGYTTPTDGISGHSAVFQCVIDKTPKIGAEHVSGEWMTPEDLMKLIREDPTQFRSNVLVHMAKHARQLF